MIFNGHPFEVSSPCPYPTVENVLLVPEPLWFLVKTVESRFEDAFLQLGKFREHPGKGLSKMGCWDLILVNRFCRREATKKGDSSSRLTGRAENPSVLDFLRVYLRHPAFCKSSYDVITGRGIRL
jgi:hypothetical protein